MCRSRRRDTVVIMNTTDMQATLTEMWTTRPARPRRDRQVAGVATAIGRRYDIDPVLVRVAFVVTAFFGIGAALYIAAWVVLPEEAADPLAPERARSPRPILIVALVIAAVTGLGSVFGGKGPGWIFPTVAALALLFLLHRSRSEHGTRVEVTRVVPTDTSTPSEAGPSLVKASPPAWDPLGAAPFAWDLPEPSPAPPAPRRRRPPVTAVTLGLALLAGGIAAAIMLAIGVLTPDNLPLLVGVPLAVLGGGLVVGAFLRAGRGLIPWALLLGVLTYGLLAAPLERWRGYEAGDLRAAPVTVSQLLPTYDRGAGDIDLDLRGLDLTVPPGGDERDIPVSVSLGAGQVTILLPRDADVTFTGSVGLGELSYGDRTEDGPGSELALSSDLGADGVRSGRLLALDVQSGLGDVEVRRG